MRTFSLLSCTGCCMQCTVSATQSSCASQEDSGVQYSYPDRGHKAALLMQPLPDIPHTEDHEEIKSCQRKTKSE